MISWFSAVVFFDRKLKFPLWQLSYRKGPREFKSCIFNVKNTGRALMGNLDNLGEAHSPFFLREGHSSLLLSAEAEPPVLPSSWPSSYSPEYWQATKWTAPLIQFFFLLTLLLVFPSGHHQLLLRSLSGSTETVDNSFCRKARRTRRFFPCIEGCLKSIAWFPLRCNKRKSKLPRRLWRQSHYFLNIEDNHHLLLWQHFDLPRLWCSFHSAMCIHVFKRQMLVPGILRAK